MLLDRDGVVIVNRAGYVKSIAEIDFIDGSVEASALLACAGYALAIVTNQACVGKGIVSLTEAQDIQNHVVHVLSREAGVRISSHLCPHLPEERCECRKPNPGMLEHALREIGGSPENAWMIGDALSDLQAAKAIGARTILVRTGLGRANEARARLLADHVADDLSAAVEWLVWGRSA